MKPRECISRNAVITIKDKMDTFPSNVNSQRNEYQLSEQWGWCNRFIPTPETCAKIWNQYSNVRWYYVVHLSFKDTYITENDSEALVVIFNHFTNSVKVIRCRIKQNWKKKRFNCNKILLLSEPHYSFKPLFENNNLDVSIQQITSTYKDITNWFDPVRHNEDERL